VVDEAKSAITIIITRESFAIRFYELSYQLLNFREKRKQEEALKDQSTSPKRKRLTPTPSSPSSSVSGGDSDSEKPLSAFYQSLLESSYAANGNLMRVLFFKNKLISFYRVQATQ
jgi:hypothetical protein